MAVTLFLPVLLTSTFYSKIFFTLTYHVVVSGGRKVASKARNFFFSHISLFSIVFVTSIISIVHCHTSVLRNRLMWTSRAVFSVGGPCPKSDWDCSWSSLITAAAKADWSSSSSTTTLAGRGSLGVATAAARVFSELDLTGKLGPGDAEWFSSIECEFFRAEDGLSNTSLKWLEGSKLKQNKLKIWSEMNTATRDRTGDL